MTRSLKSLSVFSLVLASVSAYCQDKGDAGKVSGQVLSDFYSVTGHNDPAVKGKSGFWIRRINLTYDKNLGSRLSAQLRLEAKDAGDFASTGNMDPFIKDIWVAYKTGGHTVRLGLIPTPTFGQAESKLGYRPVEKTMLDLFRMGSSRDKGISAEGPLTSDGKLNYMVMYGDASGTRSSTGDTHAYYVRLGTKVTDQISADVYFDTQDKDGGVAWRTWKGELYFVSEAFVGGVAVTSQRRSAPSTVTTNIDGISLYSEFKAGETVRPFLRYDFMGDQLPEADKIEFYKMSKDGKPTLFMVGVRVKISDNLEISPSLTTVTYRRGAGGLTPSSDTIFRLTLSAKF